VDCLLDQIRSSGVIDFMEAARIRFTQAEVDSRPWRTEGAGPLWKAMDGDSRKEPLWREEISDLEKEACLDLLSWAAFPEYSYTHEFLDEWSRISADICFATDFVQNCVTSDLSAKTKMTFYTTKMGLSGMCPMDARPGDKVAVLSRDLPDGGIPFVIREVPDSNEHYEMVGVCEVQDNLRDLSRYLGTYEPKAMTLE
jgi:hypothetical protein